MILMRIVAEQGLTLFGDDATNVYAHSPAPNETYHTIDDGYADL